MSLSLSLPLALAAAVVEALIGYPAPLYRAIGHPVTWMGRWLAWLEARLNRPTRASPRAGRSASSRFASISRRSGSSPGWRRARFFRCGALGFAALALLAASLPAQRSLAPHVRAVAEGLDAGLDEGRRAVAKIVGRNPEVLDEAGVARAAIESLAENFSDGVVAPILWIALGGLVGGALYKAINTADSMIGHKDERYAAFGWAAARLDDLVNLPASRLAALWLILAAALTPGASARGRGARRMARRLASSLAQRRLARGGDGRRARPQARRTARLWRDAGRRRVHGRAAGARPTPPTSGGRCGSIGRRARSRRWRSGGVGYPGRGKRRYRERIMTGWFGRVGIGVRRLAFMTAAAEARITHIEITKTEPAFGGQSFGDIGPYEHLTGRVTGELDPADPANSGIQDINLAPAQCARHGRICDQY